MIEYRLVMRVASTLAGFAFVVTVSGCGSDLASVRGSVQREGSPLPDGRVVFTRVGGGRTAFGEIQSDGAFELTTERPNDGAEPGTYRIRIVQAKSTDSGKLYTLYEPPRDTLMEVVAGKTIEFLINIRKQDGWQTQQED